MSSSHPYPITSHALADTLFNELIQKTGNLVSPAAGSSSASSDTANPLSDPMAGASGIETKTGDPDFCPVKLCHLESKPPPRYYVVLRAGDEKARSPKTIQVINVTRMIPKGCMMKARAYAIGVAFNYGFAVGNHFLKARLCVIGSREEPTAIDLDREPNSKVPDQEIMQALMNTQEMKAMLSSVKDINGAELIHHVGDYVGHKLGDEKKAEFLRMVEAWTPSGLRSFDSMDIWHMLTLEDRVMEAMMEIVKLALFVKMPKAIDIDIPSSSVNPLNPAAFGWKGGCSVAQGSNPRPCIPDLNQVVVDPLEEEEAVFGEEEGTNNSRKRKAEEDAVVEAQDHEVP